MSDHTDRGSDPNSEESKMNRYKKIFHPVSKVFVSAIEELTNQPPALEMFRWEKFNELVGGFRPNEFSILCGSTGSGKTTLCANISAQLCESREKHAVMSVETGPRDFSLRVVSAMSGIDLTRGLAIGREKIAQASVIAGEFLESDSLDLSNYENRVALESLTEHVECAAKQGCKLMLLDNLNFFMEVTRASDSIIEMDRIVHKLIMLVKAIPIHIVMVMHPKKTDGGRVESEFDIKGSSTAVQEAQNVFLFNRMPKEELEQNPDARWWRELKIVKMRRRGDNVGSSIVFESRQTKYVEKEYRT